MNFQAAAQAHQGVPPFGGEDAVEEDDGVGAESDAVACLGATAAGGPENRLANDGGLGEKLDGVGKAERLGFAEGFLFVGRPD